MNTLEMILFDTIKNLCSITLFVRLGVGGDLQVGGNIYSLGARIGGYLAPCQ